MLYELCRQNGFEPEIVQRFAQVTSTLETCSAGAFLTLLPDLYVHSLLPRYPDLVVRRFENDQFPYPILLCIRENEEKRDVLHAFLEYIRSLPVPHSRGAE